MTTSATAGPVGTTTDEPAVLELDRLGLRHFLDVRVTVRRILETMRRPQRCAFATAVAERLLREYERAPARERRPHLPTWRPVVDATWRGLAGDAIAPREIAAAVARFYVSPDYHTRRHDDPADADDHTIMASFYAAECYLHGCLDFAAWAGWRGFDVATVRAAGDTAWPHRRPAEVSPYAWELAHPAVQAELDQQLLDLELLSLDGALLADDQPADVDRRLLLLERLRNSQTGHLQTR
jgi:hypothetical protein